MRIVAMLCVLPAVIVSTLAAHRAAAEHFGDRKCQCPECTKVCCPEKVTKKEKEICWDVECQEVCIPPVRFPWMKCWPLSCGRVRVVKVLKKEETEVEKCELKWQVKDCCPQCRQPFRLCTCR